MYIFLIISSLEKADIVLGWQYFLMQGFLWLIFILFFDGVEQ